MQLTCYVLFHLIATAVAGILLKDSYKFTTPPQIATPQVTIRNGTLKGFHLPAFKEDIFLGIPFAAPPVDNLRLRHPIPYQNAWSGIRDATARSPSCPGYAGFDAGLSLGEGM
jgi:hypothetical protein